MLNEMKRYTHPFILALTALLVGSLLPSCHLYRHYERPETTFVDHLYRRIPTDTLPQKSPSLTSWQWQDFFTDSLLRQWITIGLRHNTDLRIAHLKVCEAEMTLKASRQAFLPAVSFNAQGSIQSVNAEAANKSYNLSPTASWEVDLFGRLQNAKRAAAAALEQSKAYEQAVQTRLVASIAEGYYTLLMLDEQLKISRHTLENWEENIRTLSALKRAGKTNEAAVLQAKANKLSVESSVLTLERQIRAQENAFCTLLAIVPQGIARGELSEQTFPEEFSLGIPMELVSRRPDVRQAEEMLAEAYYLTQEARAAFYPSITLGGTIGWSDGSGAAIANPASWLMSAVGQLTQPIFNRGRNKANLKIAQARQEQAQLAFRQQLLEAGAEVNNALILWQTARQRLEVDKKQVMTLRAAVWNTKLLMKHGLTNYLEVLTAQQNLLQAELTESTDKYDEIQGIITLYHALGGGL